MKNAVSHSILIVLFFILSPALSSQTKTLVLQPDGDKGKDALIISKNPYDTHGNHIDVAAMAWTNGGIASNVRTLIEFDLEQLPDGAYIHAASLYLYAHDSPANGSHSTEDGPNISLLSQVMEAWDEQTVNWAQQPSITDKNQILIPASTSAEQDYLDINVTFLVREMVKTPGNNHGFLLQLMQENYYRSLVFASSDHPDPSLHPKLKITYSEELETDNCLTIIAPRLQGKDAFIQSRLHNKNFGNHYDFAAMAWTNGGIPVDVRALMAIDLSQIPPNAVIDYATLSLFSHNSPANDAHSTRDGSNESLLCRIIEPWVEEEVTWDNQPEHTSQNQVLLQASESEIQDYLDIDVTTLIQDMLDDPDNSHGLLFKLVVEEYYRSMLFASTDHEDPAKHPSLEVCYSFPSSTKDGHRKGIELYPNPACTSFVLDLGKEMKEVKSIEVLDEMGRSLLKFRIYHNLQSFDVGGLTQGIYFVRIHFEDFAVNKKLVIQR